MESPYVVEGNGLRVRLCYGENIFGRGGLLQIKDARCSRKQASVEIDAATQEAKLTVIGTNYMTVMQPDSAQKTRVSTNEVIELKVGAVFTVVGNNYPFQFLKDSTTAKSDGPVDEEANVATQAGGTEAAIKQDTEDRPSELNMAVEPVTVSEEQLNSEPSASQQRNVKTEDLRDKNTSVSLFKLPKRTYQEICNSDIAGDAQPLSLALPIFGLRTGQFDKETAVKVACEEIDQFVQSITTPRIQLHVVVTDDPLDAASEFSSERKKYAFGGDPRVRLVYGELHRLKDCGCPSKIIAHPTYWRLVAGCTGASKQLIAAAGETFVHDTKKRYNVGKLSHAYPIGLHESSPLRQKQEALYIIHCVIPTVNPLLADNLAHKPGEACSLLADSYKALFDEYLKILQK